MDPGGKLSQHPANLLRVDTTTQGRVIGGRLRQGRQYVCGQSLNYSSANYTHAIQPCSLPVPAAIEMPHYIVVAAVVKFVYRGV